MKYVLLMLALASSLATFAKDLSDYRKIVVSGRCLRSAVPDRGSVEFFAEVQNFDAKKALSGATEIYESAREAVKKLNLKNAEFSSLENSLNEVREWENNKNIFKGFRARIGLRVYSTEIERLAEVFTTVSGKGINQFGGLQAELSPEKMKAEQEACLQVAVQNAKSKAEIIAKAAGSRVGKVLEITESSSVVRPSSRLVPYAAKVAMMDVSTEARPASIDTRAETIQVSVDVLYELE